MTDQKILEIVQKVAQRFQTMGGGAQVVDGNPLAITFQNKPPIFALGVDVEQVVRFVVSEVQR